MSGKNFQDVGHPVGHDYVSGSPHLKHPELRDAIADLIVSEVERIIATRGSCVVLEVGAGHGVFSSIAYEAGASVLVTEMSAASATTLENAFGNRERFEVVYDPMGEWLSLSSRNFDLALCISVLHHIPDYIGFLNKLFPKIQAGGSVITWQDPLFYPRLSFATRAIERLSYFSWRLFQGNIRRGLKTRWRRLRNSLDVSEPSDMVEYHVVRDGVDENAIIALAESKFQTVRILTYFSTQSRTIQRFANILPANTFGLLIKGKMKLSS